MQVQEKIQRPLRLEGAVAVLIRETQKQESDWTAYFLYIFITAAGCAAETGTKIVLGFYEQHEAESSSFVRGLFYIYSSCSTWLSVSPGEDLSIAEARGGVVVLGNDTQEQELDWNTCILQYQLVVRVAKKPYQNSRQDSAKHENSITGFFSATSFIYKQSAPIT